MWYCSSFYTCISSDKSRWQKSKQEFTFTINVNMVQTHGQIYFSIYSLQDYIPQWLHTNIVNENNYEIICFITIFEPIQTRRGIKNSDCLGLSSCFGKERNYSGFKSLSFNLLWNNGVQVIIWVLFYTQTQFQCLTQILNEFQNDNNEKVNTVRLVFTPTYSNKKLPSCKNIF